MYKRVVKASYFSDVNFNAYLSVLEKKLVDYGFTKNDTSEINTEIFEKLEREVNKDTFHIKEDQGEKVKRRREKANTTTQEIFYPFSFEEMEELMLQLWKSQLESTNKMFKKQHSEFRLVLIQKAIRDTMIAFFGNTIRKDQSIWIGREIHKLYLKTKASIR
jgi:hypothetical protein